MLKWSGIFFYLLWFISINFLAFKLERTPLCSLRFCTLLNCLGLMLGYRCLLLTWLWSKTQIGFQLIFCGHRRTHQCIDESSKTHPTNLFRWSWKTSCTPWRLGTDANGSQWGYQSCLRCLSSAWLCFRDCPSHCGGFTAKTSRIWDARTDDECRNRSWDAKFWAAFCTDARLYLIWDEIFRVLGVRSRKLLFWEILMNCRKIIQDFSGTIVNGNLLYIQTAWYIKFWYF